MPTQLLIDMPAEAATRLLTLSLLEQLSLHTAGAAATAAHPASLTRAHTYRATVNRVRGCTVLYAEALGVPRKARRHLRALARRVDELHRNDVQLRWAAAAARSRPSPNGNGLHAEQDATADQLRPLSQASLAALWLGERLTRRRSRLQLALEQLQDDARPFRRLTKRLGAYTTSVRLDDMMPSASFGQLTGRRLAVTVTALRAALASVASAGDLPEPARIRRRMDHVVYLLEPVSAPSNVRHTLDRAHEMRRSLESLEDVLAVADALMDGGQRVGALHLRNRLRGALLPSASHVAVDEIGPGLVALAEQLRDELSHSIDAFRAEWLTPAAETFLGALDQLAGAMSDA